MIASNKAAIFSLLAFLLGGVTAQNHFQAQQQELSSNPTPLQQLAQAEAQWKSKQIYNYAYVYNNHGSNPHNIVYPWDVTVRNGKEASGKDGTTTKSFMNPTPKPWRKFFKGSEMPTASQPSSFMLGTTRSMGSQKTSILSTILKLLMPPMMKKSPTL
ncbi:expressed unknown protein [Seminavis robusta]|uniref:Uncharacterized protein n=1 Tax=Seminavis robusta TaxID=568900 RepID=A0A9N8HRB9_9STRA|nr:expressed unknown protein [Seminavis robusta]|eukprot:Sro1548_g281560.1 n/a (158) ;mRNA; f:9957-10430